MSSRFSTYFKRLRAHNLPLRDYRKVVDIRFILPLLSLLILLTVMLVYPFAMAKNSVSLGPDAVTKGMDLRLINQYGNSLRLSEFREKPLLLSFVFTGCSSYCSTQIVHLNLLRQKLVKEIGSDAFTMVSVSLTPMADAPQDMLAFRDQFSIDAKNWHFTTGNPEHIEQLINTVGTKVKRTDDPTDLDHTTQVYVLDKQGKLLSTHHGTPLDSAGLQRVITSLALSLN